MTWLSTVQTVCKGIFLSHSACHAPRLHCDNVAMLQHASQCCDHGMGWVCQMTFTSKGRLELKSGTKLRLLFKLFKKHFAWGAAENSTYLACCVSQDMLGLQTPYHSNCLRIVPLQDSSGTMSLTGPF